MHIILNTSYICHYMSPHIKKPYIGKQALYIVRVLYDQEVYLEFLNREYLILDFLYKLSITILP